MDKINILVSQSLLQYYEILSTLGYKNYTEVLYLLILIVIWRLVNDFTEYITTDDLRTLYKVLNCISGSCIIPNRCIDGLSLDLLIHEFKTSLGLRITENNIIRQTENTMPRIIE